MNISTSYTILVTFGPETSEFTLLTISPFVAIFSDFSRWRPFAILDLIGANLDHPRRVVGGFYHCANLVTIDLVVSEKWKSQYLVQMAGKCIFTPPKLEFRDYVTPK